jgi:hypothetical protein
MKVTMFLRVSCGIFLAIALFFFWYSVAADYGYRALSGTYTFSSNEERSTLILKSDHSFQQELSVHGKLESATGTWRRIGESGVAFSKEFLIVSGQEPGCRPNSLRRVPQKLRISCFSHPQSVSRTVVRQSRSFPYQHCLRHVYRRRERSIGFLGCEARSHFRASDQHSWCYETG